MRKLAIYLLDALILLALCWLFFFRNFFESFWVFVAATTALLTSIAAWAVISARKEERLKNARLARAAELASIREHERRAKRVRQEEADRARQDLLAREHEARRPVCGHCGKKTKGVFLHRRIDGSPDRRYRHNPVLCNQCFEAYQPIRPWHLPQQAQSGEEPPRISGEASYLPPASSTTSKNAEVEQAGRDDAGEA